MGRKVRARAARKRRRRVAGNARRPRGQRCLQRRSTRKQGDSFRGRVVPLQDGGATNKSLPPCKAVSLTTVGGEPLEAMSNHRPRYMIVVTPSHCISVAGTEQNSAYRLGPHKTPRPFLGAAFCVEYGVLPIRGWSILRGISTYEQ